jgi:cytoskeletal protein CcmA (bactofilin family)
MIRMGRNSKPDTSDAPDTSPSYYPQNNGSTATQPSSTPYQYGNENMNTVSKPATESENIARDIKEGKLSGFVGHGTSLTGDTTFQMMLRVDGHLTGTVTSEGGTLIVGNSGQLDANVSVGIAQINGAVNGDIVAAERIQLGRTARVVGNISTPKLIIEDGAVFEGGCTMLKAREAQDKKTSTAATPAPAYGTSSSYSNGYSSTTATTVDDDDDDALAIADEELSETATV